ncbi:MAG: TolC family protein [Cardiobacteriaceae bacterium]|nr:TolC family protein [Cardiobacteriaceae bacterium]
MRRFFRSVSVLFFVTIACSFWACGRNLPQILRAAVVKDPQITEAQANQRVAQSTLEQTEAGRWPTLKAGLNQPVLNSNGKYKFTPGVEADWRLYDFGATNASIERDRIKTQYYKNKTSETAEELAFKIASDYLEALKARDSLKVAKENLARHDHIVKQLRIILEYDPGRRSEFTQAQARQIQVQESIISYERALGLALRRLARYVDPPVGEAELTDPFADVPITDLLSRYSVSEEDALAHPSYRAQARELESIQAALKVAERSRYPAVGLKAEANTNDSAVYLTMSVDVFNKATAPGIELQKHQAQAAQAKLQQVYDSLMQRAEVAALQMREDQSRIEVSEAQSRALEQVVVDYEDQFKIATRTLLDVVNAYSELASVKQLRVQAQYDLMQAKLEYLSATGGLASWAKLPDVSRETDEKAVKETPDKKEKTKKKTKDTAPPPLKLTSIDEGTEEASNMQLESYDTEEPAEDEPYYTGPEQVFVRVSDSGELLLENKSGNLLNNDEDNTSWVADSSSQGRQR